jgi:ferric-dicitrate binding protein FerR (iron transport regulator)
MTERDNPQNDTKDGRAPDGDEITRLLRAAGPRPGVPGDRTDRVRQAAHDRWRRVVRVRRLTLWLAWGAAPVAAAATIILLVGPDLSGWFRTGPSPPALAATLQRSEGPVTWAGREPPTIGEALRAGTALRTGAGGRVALRLRAGASVRADVETSLRLASDATLVLDRGAVYVDTRGPSGHGAGVEVRTPLGVVRSVGTQFQVRATEDAVLLSVREGTARLERDGSAHDALSGTEIRVREDGAVARRPVPPSGPEWDWVQTVAPGFDLEGRVLGEYLDWVGRETGRRVDYGDPSIATDASTVVLHGSIEGLRPDETLAVVLPTCGLGHRIRGDAWIVERAAPRAAP